MHIIICNSLMYFVVFIALGMFFRQRFKLCMVPQITAAVTVIESKFHPVQVLSSCVFMVEESELFRIMIIILYV